MMNIIRRTLVLAVLFMTAFANSYAQQSADVEAAMNKIVTKYEDTKDVSCITISKGFVLNRNGLPQFE
jgi:outer membrane lipoprotein-sorting protein